MREDIIDIRVPTENGNAALKYYTAIKHVSLRPSVITEPSKSMMTVIFPHYRLDW